jgi:hypothetical protein
MESALSYNNINKYIRLFLIYKIYTNIQQITNIRSLCELRTSRRQRSCNFASKEAIRILIDKQSLSTNTNTNTRGVLIDNQRISTISTNNIDILYKIISTNYQEESQQSKFFEKNIFTDLIILPNKSTGFIDNKLTTRIQAKFIKSLKLLLLNQKFGVYLIKYYYTIFFILHTYNSCIKHICTKIYIKANNKKNKTKQIYYNNLNSINEILFNLNQNYKFSYNDDNNYNIINNIISEFLINLQKIKIIQYKNFSLVRNKNIYMTLFQNIYNLQKNIIKK